MTDKTKGLEEQPSAASRIRITLTSTDVKSIEKVCKDLLAQCQRYNVDVKGPVRMPRKILRITTRKTPCGEGSKTWDRFQMRIYKRILDLQNCTQQSAKDVTSCTIESNVEVEVLVID